MKKPKKRVHRFVKTTRDFQIQRLFIAISKQMTDKQTENFDEIKNLIKQAIVDAQEVTRTTIEGYHGLISGRISALENNQNVILRFLRLATEEGLSHSKIIHRRRK